jgi:hypothetical protein
VRRAALIATLGVAVFVLGAPALGSAIRGAVWTAEPDQWYAHFGASVAGAGDVNGDGFSDVIVGAPDYDNGQYGEGRAYVYHGSGTGLSSTPNWTAESDQEYASFGSPVAAAGDVNGDGYDDVIVGVYHFDNGQSLEGRAFVYHGSGTGLSSTPDWTVESNQRYAFLGRSVAGAGDVNGDGFDDVIVGADGFDHDVSNEGRVLAFYGSAAGLSATPDWTVYSGQREARLGMFVAGAGDVNADGFGDVIVAADQYDDGQRDEGHAFVYLGSSSGLAATPVWTAQRDVPEEHFGVSVAGAGDVNGDGYDDVIVGAEEDLTDEAHAFVYHGSATGPSQAADWAAQANQEGAEFAASVSGAGDLNGDGYDEVLVGAPRFNNGQSDEGRVFAYCGSPMGLGLGSCWQREFNQARSHLGVSVAAAGDVDGDGRAEVIAGADEYNHGHTNEGRAFAW